MIKNIFLLILPIFILSCSKDDSIVLEDQICEMQFVDLGITEESDHIEVQIFPGLVESLSWEVNFTDDTLLLFYDYPAGDEGYINTTFKFKKKSDCILFDYGYTAQIDAVDFDWGGIFESTATYEIIVQEWIPDEKFVGRLIATENGTTSSYDFYVTLTDLDYISIEDLNYISFDDCMGNVLPLEIDLNNDGTPDFSFDSEDILVNYSTNQLSHLDSYLYFKALNPNNKVLGNFDDFMFVVQSESTIQSSEAMVYEENEGVFGFYRDYTSNSQFPYMLYNNWYENNIPIPIISQYNYIFIRMEINGQPHYGYVRFSLDPFITCSLTIEETYLNPTPNEHITIE
ncbi:hypothetical protein GZ212_08285 [Mangrovimonas sp. CR14]|uniref:hypothetical protein n=1 Tax=Mangrovimonas sp. CR14 TaxID=2706120 RepID=UPI00142337F2|nr:hypothetical protein [Mangrovimonas sp. CR14]NIK92148.1 hypothetical protein [Mangrovimonas sp. CR14]